MKFDVFKFSTFDFAIEGMMYQYYKVDKITFLNVWL